MKLLFMQKIDGVSGSEKFYLSLLPALVEKGWDVSFLCLVPGKAHPTLIGFKNELSSKGVAINELKYSKAIFPTVWRLNKILANDAYDLVCSNLIHADFLLALVKVFFARNCKNISIKHSYDSSGFQARFGFDGSRKMYNLYYFVAKFSERFIHKSYCISFGLKKLYDSLGISNRRGMDVIHYGFDFEADVNEVNALSEHRKSGFQMLMVGRLIEVKRHKDALTVLSHLAEAIPDISLVIVGDGPEKDNLKKTVSESGLDSNVHFEGFRRDVMNYYRNSDVCLVTSQAEGFGVVLLESLFCECPIVAWDVPAMNEIVVDNKCGYLVTDFNLDKLEAAIVDFYELPENTKKEFGTFGKTRVVEQFSVSAMVDKTHEFYVNILEDA